MKVLLILPNLNPGGAEQVALVLARSLLQCNVHVSLMLFSMHGAFIERVPEKLCVVGGRRNYGKLINTLFGLFFAIKKARKYDVIIGGIELSATYVAYVSGLLCNKPVVGWVHIDLNEYSKKLNKVHAYLMSFIYPRLNAIVAVSQGVANSVSQSFRRINQSKLRVIYNINDNLVVGDHLNMVPLPKRYILAIGRLVEQKGFDLLIEAHANIINQLGSVSLIILGEGQERKKLEDLVKKLGTEDYVHIIGFVQDIDFYLRHCWIFVHPARFEGLGMVLVEAMSRGVPVIAANCPSGPAEILDGGKFGILVDANSPQAIVDAVIDLSEKPEKHSLYAALGKNRASEFSVNSIVPEWIDLLNELNQ